MRSIYVLFAIFCIAGCNPRPAALPNEGVHAELRAVAEQDSLTVLETLEKLIAAGKDSKQDRQFAYVIIAKRPVNDAASAFARGAIAGRLAQLSGLSGGGLVGEVEQYARLSMEKDPNFQQGAAQRMLGSLYVLAPAMLLKQGDSEKGLELLQDLANKWPQDILNHLRLGEAYVALDDYEPAYPHLCFCVARRQQLRPDDQKLLDQLVKDSELGKCP